MRSDDLRPMYDACMRGAGRMICKRADGESSKRGRHSFPSMSGGSHLPVNEGDTWRFEKALRCSIDWAYNKPHWTTSFGRSSRSKRGLEVRKPTAAANIRPTSEFQ
eukprot:scaffold17036_cov70-Skeletonema_dohrnii-CCMP3373.AAC.1